MLHALASSLSRALSPSPSNVSNCRNYFLLDERALAGHAFPLAVLLDPRVRESRSPRVRFSLGHSRFAVHARNYTRVAVHMNLHALVVHVLGSRAGVGNGSQVFRSSLE